MSRHTPGPWHAELDETYSVRAQHGGIVAQIHHLKGRHGLGGRVGSAEAAANASVIAAAPELLDACLLFARWAQATSDFRYPPGSLQRLHEAIAKAEAA
jgi:hypothetical protein